MGVFKVADFSHESNLYKIRIWIIAVLFFAVFGIILIRLFNLQIREKSIYESLATRTTQRATVIPAKRGDIYDRNFTFPLVYDIDSFSVQFNPAEVPNQDIPKVLSLLSSILEIPVSRLEVLVPPSTYNRYQSIELKQNVTIETIYKIAEQIEMFPGVSWTNKPSRNYSDLRSLSHVIGYVGPITQEELQVLYNQGYGFGSVLGKSGIERQYDQILRGIDGTGYQIVDAFGRRIETSHQQEKPPTLGKNLVLSIDAKIQLLAEKSLVGKKGSVIVMKPATGEILAMVSVPYYDPNSFLRENTQNLFQSLLENRDHPFLNRAIQSTYPPASTFKTILTAAILDTGVIDPHRKITCNGRIRVGDRYFNCWKLSGHGPQDLAEAFANSCNVYFYTIGKDYLGPERIYEYARELSYGEFLGIDIPGEVAGNIPNPRWKLRALGSPWVGGDTVNMSIGQGFTLVSPLQMAAMMAVIVNEGKLYRPHLVKEIRDPSTNEVIQQIEPELIFQSKIKPQVFKELQWYLRNNAIRGNAHLITTKVVQVGGKTGSAETGFQNDYHNWYASFGPYDAPDPKDKIVVIVNIEAQDNIDYWAPKAANIIYQGIFANQTFEQAVRTLNTYYTRGIPFGD